MRLGKIARLRRYPVKSMRGEDLEEAFFDKNGIVGDRSFALVDQKGKDGRGFPWPWITARQIPELLLYEPKYGKEIEFWKDGNKVELQSIQSFLKKEYSIKTELKYDENGNHDSKPVSILGLETIAELERETMKLEPERFRANIYADWEEKKPFYEDDLVGKVLHLGEVELEVVKKNSRCEIPNINPRTIEISKKVLETIARNHKGCTGVYAIITKTGKARVGDEITD